MKPEPHTLSKGRRSTKMCREGRATDYIGKAAPHILCREGRAADYVGKAEPHILYREGRTTKM